MILFKLYCIIAHLFCSCKSKKHIYGKRQKIIALRSKDVVLIQGALSQDKCRIFPRQDDNLIKISYICWQKYNFMVK